MPRNISFMLTQEQFKNKTKTMTRRSGWRFAKAGEYLNGCKQCQGLKLGEKVEVIHPIFISKIWIEPLNAITQEDVIKEGFPDWTPAQFIDFYKKHNKCTDTEDVTVIEFEYLSELS